MIEEWRKAAGEAETARGEVDKPWTRAWVDLHVEAVILVRGPGGRGDHVSEPLKVAIREEIRERLPELVHAAVTRLEREATMRAGMARGALQGWSRALDQWIDGRARGIR